VRRLTKDPAEFFGVKAGEIKQGARADLVLINPEQLARYDTNANRDFIYVPHYDAKCMVNRSDGVVEQVYIAGQRVWESAAKFTKALGSKTLGKVLLAGLAAEASAEQQKKDQARDASAAA
jgi:N-acyl-D-aspartate/D-glutamate deacylase